MLSGEICLYIFYVTGFMMTNGVEDKKLPESHHVESNGKHDYMLSIMGDMKKLKDNPVLQRAEEVLNILDKWDTFAATTVEKDDVKSEMKIMNENFDMLKIFVNKVNKELKTKFEVLEDRLDNDEAKDLSFVKDDIQNVRETLRADTETVTLKLETLTRGLEQYKKEIGDVFRKQQEVVDKIRVDFLSMMNNFQSHSEYNKESEKQMNLLQRNWDETKDVLEESLPELTTEVEGLRSKAEATGHTADANKRDIEMQKDLVNVMQQEVTKLTALTNELRNKLKLYELGFLLVLGAMGAVVVMRLVNGNEQKSAISTKGTRGKQFRSKENDETYCLKWDGPLETSVCVVTFHSDTQSQHSGETRSVFESVGATPPLIHTRVIRRHTDIQNLPGSRIFLVFVDFNERNVILEDPDKGLGDLRLTTVRSLLKFGGDVSVIYCGDRGSRNLDKELFNPDLTSIYSQPELSKLKIQQRMFSIYDRMTEFQKEHCRIFINSQLKQA